MASARSAGRGRGPLVFYRKKSKQATKRKVIFRQEFFLRILFRGTVWLGGLAAGVTRLKVEVEGGGVQR